MERVRNKFFMRSISLMLTIVLAFYLPGMPAYAEEAGSPVSSSYQEQDPESESDSRSADTVLSEDTYYSDLFDKGGKFINFQKCTIKITADPAGPVTVKRTLKGLLACPENVPATFESIKAKVSADKADIIKAGAETDRDNDRENVIITIEAAKDAPALDITIPVLASVRTVVTNTSLNASDPASGAGALMLSGEANPPATKEAVITATLAAVSVHIQTVGKPAEIPLKTASLRLSKTKSLITIGTSLEFPFTVKAATGTSAEPVNVSGNTDSDSFEAKVSGNKLIIQAKPGSVRGSKCKITIKSGSSTSTLNVTIRNEARILKPLKKKKIYKYRKGRRIRVYFNIKAVNADLPVIDDISAVRKGGAFTVVKQKDKSRAVVKKTKAYMTVKLKKKGTGRLRLIAGSKKSGFVIVKVK
ncbi:MAG: hypothetical protein VZR23_05040 [Lachnospiraceae bacterium]|nr:hypothetical protein [Lachnospiraceae bacterium]